MTKKELDEEIEFIHSNRLRKGMLRHFDLMKKVILKATNTYTNISLFMNDYIKLYKDGKIDGNQFNSAMNDLYLLALYILAVRGGRRRWIEEDVKNNGKE